MARFLAGYVIRAGKPSRLNSFRVAIPADNPYLGSSVADPFTGGGVGDWSDIRRDGEFVFSDHIPLIGETILIQCHSEQWFTFRDASTLESTYALLQAKRGNVGYCKAVLAVVAAVLPHHDTLTLHCVTGKDVIVLTGTMPHHSNKPQCLLPLPNGHRLSHPITGFGIRTTFCAEHQLDSEAYLPPTHFSSLQVVKIHPSFWLGVFAIEFESGLDAATIFARHSFSGCGITQEYVAAVQEALQIAASAGTLRARLRTHSRKYDVHYSLE